MPTIFLTGGPGSRSEEFGDLLDNRFRTWDISGSVTQPLFNGGRIRASIRRAEAVKKAAEANYRAVAIRAFTEVETFANEEFLQKRKVICKTHLWPLLLLQKLVGTATNGVQGIFDTLESQRRAFDAESRLLKASRDRIFNRINLFLAVGTPALPTEP